MHDIDEVHLCRSDHRSLFITLQICFLELFTLHNPILWPKPGALVSPTQPGTSHAVSASGANQWRTEKNNGDLSPCSWGSWLFWCPPSKTQVPACPPTSLCTTTDKISWGLSREITEKRNKKNQRFPALSLTLKGSFSHSTGRKKGLLLEHFFSTLIMHFWVWGCL